MTVSLPVPLPQPGRPATSRRLDPLTRRGLDPLTRCRRDPLTPEDR